MKKIIRISIYFFTSLSLFTGCEKDLNLSPLDKYSEATFFQNAEQFKLFANQFYNELPTSISSFNRELFSDLMIDWNPNDHSNSSYYPTPSSGNWEGSYKIIRNANYLIEKVEQAEDIQQEISSYKGEGYFFRSWAYYNLLKDFGGVPVLNKVLTLEDTDLLYGKRDSRETVVSFIMESLNHAIGLLPYEKEIPESDKGRISKEAALSFKARVALFEGTWRKFRGEDGSSLLTQAAEASGAVIDGGQFELFDRRDVLAEESYRYFFILDKVQTNVANLVKTDQNEFILTNRFDRDLRGGNSPGANKVPSATLKIADLFLCDDGLPIDQSPRFMGRKTVDSEYQNRDLRMTNVLQVPFSVMWCHYPPEYNRSWEDPFAGGTIHDMNFGTRTITGYYSSKFRVEIATPYGNDYPVIRLAEVLLIHAEALFEKNGSISDAELDKTINPLRTRAGMPRLTNAFVTSNGLDMQTEIRRERTVELFLEGFRFDDLRRWKTAETEMSQAIKGVMWEGTQYETDERWSSIEVVKDSDGHIILEPSNRRKFEEKHYLLPLPTRQILLNPNLEQNPGWD